MQCSLLYLAALLATSAACGCGRNSIVCSCPSNLPPIVWLSAAPPEGSVATNTVRLFWGGWDPDGAVSHYDYLITDNDNARGVFSPWDTLGAPWQSVYANDSTFVFSADSLVGVDSTGVSEFQRSHTFLVKAVDNEGSRSSAAYRTFTARAFVEPQP